MGRGLKLIVEALRKKKGIGIGIGTDRLVQEPGFWWDRLVCHQQPPRRDPWMRSETITFNRYNSERRKMAEMPGMVITNRRAVG